MSVVLPITEDDGQGGSILTTIEIDEHDGDISGSPVLISDPMPAQTVLFVDTTPETKDEALYKPPNRQLAVILKGTIEIEDSHGNTRQLGQGDAAIAADTQTGHISRLIDKPVEVLLINLLDN